MNTRGKSLKGERSASMSFGELVQKLWQPNSEELKPKAGEAKRRKPAAKGKRTRKS